LFELRISLLLKGPDALHMIARRKAKRIHFILVLRPAGNVAINAIGTEALTDSTATGL
jgi:hypothetical protein